jgi:hypothetical protein
VAASKIVTLRVEMETPLVAIDSPAAWAFFEQLVRPAVSMRVYDSVSDLSEK